jgi:protein required for attachment to host cells
MSHSGRHLIVLADTERARFLRLGGRGSLHTISAFESTAAHHQSSDLGSDGPGAALHSRSTAHHAFIPRHDLHYLAEQKFAGLIADQINEAAREGTFDQLVLVAQPHVSSAIRKRLGHDVANMIEGIVNKNLVKTPDHHLIDHLREWLSRSL